eukprot:TRINITY_DN29175_c0_g1_i1.p1 TRINITY_DN29175_c0_g1~~TRINITY_DN29175_c0_g1_i1.p1  ORF type:complete len:751 (+),score=92.26 TRINITY_DN29175_c0_g1_i1:43-2253(+)
MDVGACASVQHVDSSESPPGFSALLHMPNEVWTGIAWSLNAQETSQVANSCKMLASSATDNELWLHLFMSTCWPPSSALLALTEGGTVNLGDVDWRSRLQMRAAAPPTLVVDVGQGYTKWSIVDSITGRPEGDVAPNIVQLCSSPTHPPDCDRDHQLQYIFDSIDRILSVAAKDPLHPYYNIVMAPASFCPSPGTVALLHNFHEDLDGEFVRLASYDESSKLWQVERISGQRQRVSSASSESSMGTQTSRRSSRKESMQVAPENLKILRRAKDLPLLIGEPFACTVERVLHGVNVGESQFALNVRRELADRASARIVPQAQMSLWAHGVDHGIVVNIGQQRTIAVAIVNGEAKFGCALNIGSARLTIYLLNLMEDRHGIDQRLMTWCRDMKERHCYVAPPAPFAYGGRSLAARLEAGDDFGIQRIEVQTPQGRTIEMAEERVMVPELFFQQNSGLPDLILRCAEEALSKGFCEEEGVRMLLQQIVIVGGAADFPGMRPRVEFEVRALLRERASQQLSSALLSTEHAYVLNPPVGKAGPLITPRFVPLFGGCARAASSLNLDEALQPLHSAMDDATESPTNVGLAHRMRMNLLLRSIRSGAAVFRTGGGGGEDDNIWQLFEDDAWGESDTDDDSDDEEQKQSSELSVGIQSDEDINIDLVPEDLDGTGEEESPTHNRVQRRRRGGNGGKGCGSGAGRVQGKGKGKNKGKYTGNGAYSAKGKSRGKGKVFWRPVVQQG